MACVFLPLGCDSGRLFSFSLPGNVVDAVDAGNLARIHTILEFGEGKVDSVSRDLPYPRYPKYLVFCST